MPRKETYSGPLSAQAQQDLVSEGIENFELPKSVVMKIAKSSIPDNVKLQKETVLSLVKGSTVFINYLAATAHDVALGKQHKSISASDVLKALEMIEFGDMVQKLQTELNVYRDLSKNDKSGRKPSSSNARRASTSNGGNASSASASASRGKGKDRAPASNQPPFTSAPLDSASAASASGAMDVDNENDVIESASFAPGGPSEQEWQELEEHAGSDAEVLDEDEGDEEPEPLPEEDEPVDTGFDLRDNDPGLDDNDETPHAW